MEHLSVRNCVFSQQIVSSVAKKAIFFHGKDRGQIVENCHPTLGISDRNSWSVNCPGIRSFGLFATTSRLWKSTRFYPHCQNYQYVDFFVIRMQKSAVYGHPPRKTDRIINIPIIEN
jgi:hypothetical protein